MGPRALIAALTWPWLLSACESGRSEARIAPPPSASSNATLAASGAKPPFDCALGRERIEARFAQAARCEADADCMSMAADCPFGCSRAVHRLTDLTLLGEEIQAYKAACNPCRYRCRPDSRAPRCEAGRCRLNEAPHPATE